MEGTKTEWKQKRRFIKGKRKRVCGERRRVKGEGFGRRWDWTVENFRVPMMKKKKQRKVGKMTEEERHFRMWILNIWNKPFWLWTVFRMLIWNIHILHGLILGLITGLNPFNSQKVKFPLAIFLKLYENNCFVYKTTKYQITNLYLSI